MASDRGPDLRLASAPRRWRGGPADDAACGVGGQPPTGGLHACSQRPPTLRKPRGTGYYLARVRAATVMPGGGVKLGDSARLHENSGATVQWLLNFD